MSTSLVFTDVSFINTSADLTPLQLLVLLKSARASSNYLTRIPANEIAAATISTERFNGFTDVAKVNDNTIITIQDPCCATIWTLSAGELIIKHRFDTLGNKTDKYSWEIIVEDNLAYILQFDQILVVDVLNCIELPTITLIDEVNYRYSHPTMLKTNDMFILPHGEKIGFHSLNGDKIRETQMSYDREEHIYTTCKIDNQRIAIGSSLCLRVFNIHTDRVEWEMESDSVNIISVVYFAEFDILVYGTGSGDTVFMSLKDKKMLYKSPCVHGWSTLNVVSLAIPPFLL
jgi:hypothetical protein